MSQKNKHSKLEYFQRNAAGEYIYTGAHMTYVSEGKSRKRLLTELWGTGIGGGICLLAGWIPAHQELSGLLLCAPPLYCGAGGGILLSVDD